MPRYLIQANYVGSGIKGLIREGGSKRRAAVEKAVKSVGGSMECFYFAFGDADAYVIVDLPDHHAAAALSLTVNASGAATGRTTVLLSPEEMDKAVKLSPSYRPPGGRA